MPGALHASRLFARAAGCMACHGVGRRLGPVAPAARKLERAEHVRAIGMDDAVSIATQVKLGAARILEIVICMMLVDQRCLKAFLLVIRRPGVGEECSLLDRVSPLLAGPVVCLARYGRLWYPGPRHRPPNARVRHRRLRSLGLPNLLCLRLRFRVGSHYGWTCLFLCAPGWFLIALPPLRPWVLLLTPLQLPGYLRLQRRPLWVPARLDSLSLLICHPRNVILQNLMAFGRCQQTI